MSEKKVAGPYPKKFTNLSDKKRSNQTRANNGKVIDRVPNEGARQRPGKNIEPLDQSGDKGTPRHSGRELPPGSVVIGKK